MQQMALTLKSSEQSSEIEGIVHGEEAVSAWIDGESATGWPDELDTAAGRKTWDAYHLIGDVLRTADLSINPSAAFSARLAQALADEPAIIARPRRALTKIGLSGLAVAAVVASVVWLARPDLMDADLEATVLVEAGAASTITPELNDYLDAHWQMAGPGVVRYVSLDGGAGR